MRAWQEQRSFHELLALDPEVSAALSAEELKACFDPSWHLRNVDAIYQRLGLLP
jgi:adenylosuccinate lyase